MNHKHFSFEEIKNFDEHISKSIPMYDDLQNLIIKISDYFILENTNVYDIGCSTGSLLKKIQNKTCNKFGLDISKNLLPKNEENNIFLQVDICNFKYHDASFVISLFTLQFLPKFKRLKLLKDIFDGILEGGAFILAEKIFYENSKINSIISSLYYEKKLENFSAGEVLDKERDLRFIMSPLTSQDNLSLLKNAGFSKIEIIKKDYQFEVYLCIK